MRKPPPRQSYYLGAEITAELAAESERTGMAKSALMQAAWRIARGQIMATIPPPDRDLILERLRCAWPDKRVTRLALGQLLVEDKKHG